MYVVHVSGGQGEREFARALHRLVFIVALVCDIGLGRLGALAQESSSRRVGKWWQRAHCDLVVARHLQIINLQPSKSCQLARSRCGVSKLAQLGLMDAAFAVAALVSPRVPTQPHHVASPQNRCAR